MVNLTDLLFDMVYTKIMLLKVLTVKSQLGMMELLEQKNAQTKFSLKCYLT